MKAYEAEKLITVIRELAEPDASRKPSAAPAAGLPLIGTNVGAALVKGAAVDTNGTQAKAFDDPKVEQLYVAFKHRFIDEARIDPVLLHLLTVRPEIVVEVEPRRQTFDMNSLRGRIARLAVAKFFEQPRKQGEVKRELVKTGPEPAGNRLSEAITALVNDGFLVRDQDTYVLAPGVKISEHQLEA